MMPFLRPVILALLALLPHRLPGGETAPDWQLSFPDHALTRPLPLWPPADEAYQAALAAGTRSADGSPGQAYWQNAAAYAFDLTVDPASGEVQGEGRLSYHNRSPLALDELHLELALNVHQPGAPWTRKKIPPGSGLLIDDLRLGEHALVASDSGPGYSIDFTLMIVRLPEPLAAGASLDLDLRWHFTLPTVGCGGRMGSDREHLVHLAYWYPVFRVFDDVRGWHDEPFLGAAEFHNDFADFDTRIRVPRGWLVTGTGTWVEPERCLDGPTRERLATAAASDEVTTLASPDTWETALGFVEGDNLVWRLRAEGVRDQVLTLVRRVHWQRARAAIGDRDGDGNDDHCIVDSVFRAKASPLWQAACSYQQHALAAHSRLSGLPYPWPHMLAVEGEGLVGGGMEYPMVTLVKNPSSPYELYNVVSHELGHMWWPMQIGIDERVDGWLDEGLTTYAENRARTDFAALPGNDGHAEERKRYRQAAGQREVLIAQPSDGVGSMWDYFISAYVKPASVLRALQWELGTETFDAALQHFSRSWLGRHPHPQDFFACFETASGRDLGWFWRSWFHEAWSCDHAVWAVRERAGRWQVVIRDFGQGLLDCQVAIACSDGTQFTVPIEAESSWALGHRFAIIDLRPGLVPTSIDLDPEDRSLDCLDANDHWLAPEPELPPEPVDPLDLMP
jgi:hypothetical protein